MPQSTFPLQGVFILQWEGLPRIPIDPNDRSKSPSWFWLESKRTLAKSSAMQGPSESVTWGQGRWMPINCSWIPKLSDIWGVTFWRSYVGKGPLGMYTGILMKCFPGRDHGPVASVIRLDAVCREGTYTVYTKTLFICFWSSYIIPLSMPFLLPFLKCDLR